jgi:hypothetical protein
MKLNARVLLLLVFGSAVAAAGSSKVFGDWIVDFTDDHSTIYAATVNDSNAVLGEYCTLSTHECSWLLGMEVACEDSGSFPALGSTSTGAASLNLVCGGKLDTGKYYQYIFAKWQDVETLLKDAGMVGFAFPLADGKFKVSRFSLKGRTDAMELAEAVAFDKPESHPKATQTGTADTTL